MKGENDGCDDAGDKKHDGQNTEQTGTGGEVHLETHTHAHAHSSVRNRFL